MANPVYVALARERLVDTGENSKNVPLVVSAQRLNSATGATAFFEAAGAAD